jgi:PIN domain nuclease of toxin-antitoxin system
MPLLLDTHVVLWWLVDDPGLSEAIKDSLDHDPDVYVSTATVWEVAIKHALGKLVGPTDLPEQVRDSGFRSLLIADEHAIVAARLPRHHRDPFDRMLIAQALVEGLTLVTRDPEIQKYAVPIQPA